MGSCRSLTARSRKLFKIYDKIIRECDKRGLYPGIHCSGPAGATKHIGMGFRLVTLASDSGIMAAAAKQMGRPDARGLQRQGVSWTVSRTRGAALTVHG